MRGRRPASLRAGFTLTEVAVVVALLAMMAGTVTVSLRGNLQASRVEMGAEQLSLVDRQCRELARRSGRIVRVQFDRQREQVRREMGERSSVVESGLKFSEMRLAGQHGAERDGVVEFRADGSTETYAVCLRGDREAQQWLVFAGLSGQVLRTSDEREVRVLLGL